MKRLFIGGLIAFVLAACTTTRVQEHATEAYAHSGLKLAEGTLWAMSAAYEKTNPELSQELADWAERITLAFSDLVQIAVDSFKKDKKDGDYDSLADHVTKAAAMVSADIGADTVAWMILQLKPVVRELLEELSGIFDDPPPPNTATGSSD